MSVQQDKISGVFDGKYLINPYGYFFDALSFGLRRTMVAKVHFIPK